MNWYYVDNGQQRGPVTEEQLEGLLRSGKIIADTLIWREGMPDWLPYGQVNPAAASMEPSPVQPPKSSVPTGPSGVCAQCGGMFSLNEMTRQGDVYICANCKPAFLQKSGARAATQTGAMQYAGFWIRFAAKIVDNLILGVVVFVPVFIFVFLFSLKAASAGGSGLSTQHHFMSGGTGAGTELLANFIGLFVQLIFIALNGVYTIFFLGKYGATPGKMVCGLKVVTADGSDIGYGRATGRFFAEILSGIICYIGYIIAGFDDQKRTLHDHICNTRVIYK